ncbi:hypothetical protein C8F01DRAFT_1145411 [Mycena amicta]|nr:hypothetical protein C8F01DRAFT_1145411 [Mycena amicta]
MMTADSDPFFPPELEQAIFEMAALMFPKKVPELLLVAQRVHFWLEPFLYRRLCFDSVHRRSWQAVSEKPPSFLARAVRSLVLGLPSEQDLVQWIYAVLRRCTGVTHLVVHHDGHAPELLTILGCMRLQCLALSLTASTPNPSSLVGRDPAFRFLTHLEIFDRVGDVKEFIVPFVSTLPCVTHLAFRLTMNRELMQAILSSCKHLLCLVLLSGSPAFAQGRADALSPWLSDRRVVFTDYKTWDECISEGQSYWDIADTFIENKRRGVAPEGEFSTIGDGERLPGVLYTVE